MVSVVSDVSLMDTVVVSSEVTSHDSGTLTVSISADTTNEGDSMRFQRIWSGRS